MAADDDEKLVAYCGLYCGDCFMHRQKVADLARDLRKELRESKFKGFAEVTANTGFGKAFKDYGECYDVLGAMVKLRCHKGCRAGGGPPFCKIRTCCEKKGLQGCWACDDADACTKLDFLDGVHGDAHRKNLRAIRKKGTRGFIDGKRNW